MHKWVLSFWEFYFVWFSLELALGSQCLDLYEWNLESTLNESSTGSTSHWWDKSYNYHMIFGMLLLSTFSFPQCIWLLLIVTLWWRIDWKKWAPSFCGLLAFFSAIWTVGRDGLIYVFTAAVFCFYSFIRDGIIYDGRRAVGSFHSGLSSVLLCFIALETVVTPVIEKFPAPSLVAVFVG